MSKGLPGLGDTFPCAANSGIVANRVLVMDPATRGNVKLPAAGPEKTAAGVAMEKASQANNVAAQVSGIAVIESDGSAVINPGDYVVCGGGSDGRIKAQALAAGNANTYNIIGMCVAPAQVPAIAGALCEVRLNPFIATAA